MHISESQYQQLIGNYTKENKYHNKKVEYDGIKFDSIKERNRYIGLKQLERLGVIQNLQRQVKYELQPSFKLNGNTIRSITYIADFVYTRDGEEIIEDTKGFRTNEYLLKKKLFEYKYKKEIKEI